MESQLFSLEDRVALVTGGNGGIGRAIALGFAAHGAAVAVTGRNATKNAQVADELGEGGEVIAADVRDEAAVSAAVARAVERFGHLDILVNNAGNYAPGSVMDLSEADWRAVLDTHLTGSFLFAKHAARAMVEQGGGGSIINIGSIYSLFGPPAAVNYAAAKSGLLGLTRALAVELGEHGIRANAILPGWIETDLTKGAPPTEWGERIRRKTPSARWGQPRDLVGAAVFLASAASEFVSGAALSVDGGYAVADRLLPE